MLPSAIDGRVAAVAGRCHRQKRTRPFDYGVVAHPKKRSVPIFIRGPSHRDRSSICGIICDVWRWLSSEPANHISEN